MQSAASLAHLHTCQALTLVLCLQYPFPPNAPRTAAVQLGFLPLNHLMGRMTLLKCLIVGGQVGRRLFSCFAFSRDHCSSHMLVVCRK